MPEWLVGALVGAGLTVFGSVINHILTTRRDKKREEREEERKKHNEIRESLELPKKIVPASSASNKATYDSDAELRTDIEY